MKGCDAAFWPRISQECDALAGFSAENWAFGNIFGRDRHLLRHNCKKNA
jgi:hypothetical protein